MKDRNKPKKKKPHIPVQCIRKEPQLGNPLLLKEWFSSIDQLKKDNQEEAQPPGKDYGIVIN